VHELLSMQILIITPFIPYPLDTGGRLAQFALIDKLRDKHSFNLLLYAYNQKDIENIEALKKLWPDVAFEIVIPFPIKHEQITEAEAIEEDNEATVPPDAASLEWVYSELEEPYFISIGQPKYKAFIDALPAGLWSKKYDVVQIEFIDYIDLVYIVPQGIKKVFVHHELRFARLETFLAANKREVTAYEDYVLRHVKSTEINMLNQYDAIFTLSENDKQKLQNESVVSPVYVSQFPLLDDSFKELPEAINVNKLVCIGGDSHYPNIDAVVCYRQEIEKKVWEHHQLKLHVVGKWSQQNKKSNKWSSIVFEGFVDDIATYCKDSIMLVPVRIGSGLRTKILIAFAQGVPVITTSAGCEGIQVRDKQHLLIADTPEAYVKAITFIKNCPQEVKQMLQNAQQLVKEMYSPQTACQLRDSYYHEIRKSTVNSFNQGKNERTGNCNTSV
jgi:glycosyltransferase involved in cell wall biosynthesis